MDGREESWPPPPRGIASPHCLYQFPGVAGPVEGESLRTGDNGEAEVELECGSAVRLAPNSRLTFSHLRRRDDGVTATTVVLERGRVFFYL
ncbi:MAG TPA: FecR domain-containing protein, partial [Terriglobales bacterium]